jgi:hypothetical protein
LSNGATMRTFYIISSKISNCGLALIVALSLNKILLLFETHLFFERLSSTKIFPLKTPVERSEKISCNLGDLHLVTHVALKYSGLHVAFRQ